jgi:addiction module RelE/StbE family toxin
LEIEVIRNSLLETSIFCDYFSDFAEIIDEKRCGEVLDQLIEPKSAHSDRVLRNILSGNDEPILDSPFLKTPRDIEGRSSRNDLTRYTKKSLLSVLSSELKSFKPLRFPDPNAKEWIVKFTPTFAKSLKKCDGKLKSKVTDAVSELSRNPLTVKGNTIKPLSRNLKGLWRYRIGGYRIVYTAEITHRPTIILLSFSSRDVVYS